MLPFLLFLLRGPDIPDPPSRSMLKGQSSKRDGIDWMRRARVVRGRGCALAEERSQILFRPGSTWE